MRSLHRNFLLIVTSMSLFHAVHAQNMTQMPRTIRSPDAVEEQDEIETDRDSFTPSTSTAGAGRVIVEAAYSFIDNPSVAETHSFPELLVRGGVTDWLELRLGWNYEIGGASSPVSGNTIGEFGDEFGGESELEREARLLYGFKALLNEQEGWLPESSVILQGFTPTSGKSTETQLSTTYVFGWSMPGGAVWDSAIRYGTSQSEEDRFNVWSPSTVVKIPIGRRWKAHAEYFGILSDGRAEETDQHFFSPGAHYLINSDVEIGLRVGWGLNDASADFFSNVGLGWRF